MSVLDTREGLARPCSAGHPGPPLLTPNAVSHLPPRARGSEWPTAPAGASLRGVTLTPSRRACAPGAIDRAGRENHGSRPPGGRLLGARTRPAAGALSGMWSDNGIDDDFIRSLGETLEPGTSALFILVRRVTLEQEARLQRALEDVAVAGML
jgi:hypothetical protein